MLLKPMRFKDYTWPHNPEIYAVEYRRQIAAHKIPLGGWYLQDLGRTYRIFRGEGIFAGERAYEEFQTLAEVFDQTGPGLLVHPVWRTVSAYFVTLELMEDEDILEAGIQIIAQPPGKKLQNMMQLSGGEKAFVAIALYFSILKVHPTPFCVMDEIEAALDDANVTRYARYMRTLAGRTQFIVITHRRGTMEEADVLYGVTMQEQGVSKILTINLNDMAKELKIK